MCEASSFNPDSIYKKDVVADRHSAKYVAEAQPHNEVFLTWLSRIQVNRGYFETESLVAVFSFPTSLLFPNHWSEFHQPLIVFAQ